MSPTFLLLALVPKPTVEQTIKANLRSNIPYRQMSAPLGSYRSVPHCPTMPQTTTRCVLGDTVMEARNEVIGLRVRDPEYADKP